MSDFEFEILDALYFVRTFPELSAELEEPAATTLRDALAALTEKGWVKCLDRDDAEIRPPARDVATHYAHYRYLATKEGLLAHNGMG